MTSWLKGKRGGLIALLAVAGLVLGGLTWLTRAALELEQKEYATRVEAELNNQLRVALWRLDSRIFPLLALESSRPYYHYTPTYSPPWALQQAGKQWNPAKVIEPSPLLNDPLPGWILLHFQVSEQGAWQSPQVPNQADVERLNALAMENVTTERQKRLDALKGQLTAKDLFSRVEQRANQQFLMIGSQLTAFNLGPPGPGRYNDANRNALYEQNQPPSQQATNPPAPQGQKADTEFQSRAVQRAQIEAPNFGNTGKKQADARDNRQNPGQPEEVAVNQGLTAPLWIHEEGKEPMLLAARLVEVGKQRYCQAMLLDWPVLEQVLLAEVQDLFPAGTIRPVYADAPTHPERTMTALPLELDPGPIPDPHVEGNTPLRIGLTAAWGAALIALLAVGLGGWSLIDLSERRIRFVSAVTHELRTPLTTLRLYLDMLTGGMVKEPERQAEYLHTLNAESERLNRLISNVLDFSRLENQRPRLEQARIGVQELLDQVRTTWQDRCKDAGKALVVDSELPAEAEIVTDGRLVQQILASLIENACKYSRGASDPQVRVAARGNCDGVQIEVEDHGPGVSSRDRRLVFRPFHRGRDADPTAGGVGLGLALAHRWAQLLGGSLMLLPRPAGQGACFRLTLPFAR